MKKETALPNFPEMEMSTLKFWERQNVFERLKAKNKNSKKYFAFLDGPITANYSMGLHHAWNRSLKDIMLRFAAMSGADAHYQNGFDSHGLPVEIRVEKELGLDSKRDIERYGVLNFIEKCMQTVDRYAGMITNQSKRLGQWMDWDDSYFTNSNENITAIWHFLKICHKNGWIVEKYRPTPWCIRCGTALSEHEMSDADAYKDVEHTAVFFKLPVKNSNMSLVVWTTTPWTLSSNVAVAVNEEFEYSVCKVKSDERLLVVASTATKVLKDDLISIEKVVKGSDLVGLEYETCFPEFEDQNFPHVIIPWKEVSSEEGSGMVHIAPGCGAEDFDLGQTLGLPNIIPIDEAGIFYDKFGFLSGKNANDVADEVFSELKERGKLYYTHKYKHRYPHCWRCHHSVLFRLVKNWVIKMDEIRPRLIDAIDGVEFQPDFMKKRMLDWLVNMGDWSISRKRYYGIPLPFYICPECGEFTVVGSLSELEKLSSKSEVNSLPHLHRPYIDDIKIRCPKCGERVSRVSDVGDCWLDAGITPFSTKKYFTDKKFFERNFPVDVVLEGREQVRLWFYSLLVMSVAIMGKSPFKKVVCTAMLLDRDGKKLSKSSPNNISIDEGFEKIGADVIRYMFASNNMLSDVRFSFDATDEIRRKFLAFWNTYLFFNTYAILDKPKLEGFVPDKKTLDKTDKWLIEKTNDFIRNSRENYKNQNFAGVTEGFENIVEELSNWYIRVNRKRFWKSDDEADKKNAYFSLYYALKNIIKVMSPTTPFLSEYIWQNLVREVESNESESIFLSGFAEQTFEVGSANIVKQTVIAREIISIAGRLRNENQLKIKQPLRAMYLNVDGDAHDASKTFEDIIKEELNIKDIIFESDNNKFNDAFLGVNFKTAGLVLKGSVQEVKNILAAAKPEEMAVYVDGYNRGSVDLPGFAGLDSSLFVLSYKSKQEFVIATENKLTVVLDTTLDRELLLEGMYRELVRGLQVMRKDADFDISDRICVSFETESKIVAEVLEKFESKIKREVLIKSIENLNSYVIKREIEIGDEKLSVVMSK